MEKELKKIIAFIREYYKKNKLDGCVLGISGGKDSAVVSALMCRALGSNNVIGLTLPCHSNEKDSVDAKIISNCFDFKLLNIDLTEVFDVFKSKVSEAISFSCNDAINSDINFKPRLRMTSCYYMAALMSSIYNKRYLVVGTSNKSELFVGYFTKGGDSVHDINPIGDLTVSEVIKLGELLDVPKEILYKAPSDGLSNKTDEDKLGVTYFDIERYMNGDKELDKDIALKIEKLHNDSLHKFNIPVYRKNEKCE